MVDALNEVKSFLNSNQNEVVTIIFENQGSNEQLMRAIDSLDLDQMAYIHTNGTDWPTIQNMVTSNKRLVMFVEFTKTPTTAYLMHAWSTIFDTKYTYHNVGEFDAAVNRGSAGSKELYLVNHFLQNGLSLPDKNLAPQANSLNVLQNRIQTCSSSNNHRVNFLGVDFYEIGYGKNVVDSLNR